MSVFLRIIASGEHQEVPLKNGRYSLGRGEEARIQIFSPQISRLHADIIIENEEATILDRGSANGTAVNGHFITTSRLHSGDQILLGDIVVEYIDTNPPLNAPIRSVQRESKTNVLAATRVIAEKIRPRSLLPLFCGSFAVGFFVLAFIASLSYETVIQEKLNTAYLFRGHDLVRYLAEKNKTDITSSNELLLDTDTLKKEKGVIEAFLIHTSGKVLSPIQYRNRIDNDPLVHEALNQNSNQKILPGPKSSSGTYTFVHPIRTFDTKSGNYQTVGAAKILYSPSQAIESVPELNQLKGFLLLAALALSILFGWLLTKALSQPISHLADRIQRWRSGQQFQRENVPYKDWASLYEAVDLTIEDSDHNE